MLSGYKTYIVAIAALLWAAVGYYFGYLDVKGATEIVSIGLAAAGLRSGMNSQLTILLQAFGITLPANASLSVIKAAAAKAGEAAKRVAPSLLVLVLATSVFLGGCTSGFFSNPQNDLNVAKVGFSTALALYNSICGQNPDLAVCTADSMAQAAKLERAVTDAISAAEALLAVSQGVATGTAPTDQQIADSIQKITDAVTAFNDFANQLQVKKAALVAAKFAH